MAKLEFDRLQKSTLFWLVLFLGSTLFLVFFRARYALTLNYATFATKQDDNSYLTHSLRFCDWLGVCSAWQSDWFSNVRSYEAIHPIGIAVSWFIPLTLARLLSLFISLDPVVLIGSLIGLWSFICVMIGAWFFLNPLELRREELLWVGVPAFLCLPVLFYGTHRTTLVHSFEFLLASLFSWLFFQAPTSRANRVFQVVVVTLLAATRYQHFILLPLLALYWMVSAKRGFVTWLLCACAVAVPAVLAVLYWPSNYIPDALIHRLLATFASWSGLYQPFNPLLDLSWGLLWLSFPCVLIFGYVLRLGKRMSLKTALVLAWFLVDYLLVVVWRNQGDEFGYRYLIGPMSTVLYLYCELPEAQRKRLWSFRKLFALSASLNLFILWMFKTQPALSLTPQGPTLFYSQGWRNHFLILKSFRSLLSDPAGLVRPAGLSPIAQLAFQFMKGESLAKFRFASQGTTLILGIATLLALVVWLFGFKRLFACDRKGVQPMN